ncbi:MAG: hypothetical protein AAF726_19105 [Planctomycetota bacterium]
MAAPALPALVLAIAAAAAPVGLARLQETTRPLSEAAAERSERARFVPRTPLERALAERFGEHAIAVVGDDLITRDEVLRFIAASPDFEDPAEGLPDLPPERVMELRVNAGLRQMIEQKLKVEGGRNQGYEPEMLAQIQKNFFEQKIAEFGGESQANRLLAEQQMTPNDFREMLGKRLLSQFWQDAVTGRSVGPTGRRFVDPYVRPGTLYSRYRTYVKSRDLRLGEIVGKSPERVVLGRLVLAAKGGDPGAVEKAKGLADAIRTNIESGVLTFDDAILQYAATNFRGPMSRIEFPARTLEAELTKLHPTFDAGSFLGTSSNGTLSPVLRVDLPDSDPVFVLYRFEERLAPKAADSFLDLELQQRLKRSIEEEESDVRIARGLGELVRRTYVAPDSIRDALLQGGRRGPDGP